MQWGVGTKLASGLTGPDEGKKETGPEFHIHLGIDISL